MTPARGTRRKKNSDPFFDNPLVDTTSSGTDVSPSTRQSGRSMGQIDPSVSSPDDDSDSCLTHLILTPLYFTSFLLSLLLVDRRDREYRVSEHSTPSTPHAWHSRWDPEPYQQPGDSTWQSSHSRPNIGPGGKVSGRDHEHRRLGKIQTGRWYVREMHRKVMRMEVTEAFEMRGEVMVALVVGMVVLMGIVGWIVWKLWRRWLAPW
ncbi:hypothetical protein P152DRAFT_480087 [Eremomyces bilateralis CBS 781.70]|uniref:Uncharacterized protein n=1 Tax=Eremomyces bilateralis CBS 781.70 TaxID=1392243 RepID=A0A6G1GAB2_9PEZI|nr:uncharacterized protein P152DRAFT_480087 [Eremomyces bilateralis CBS 781.70]KAF1814973.1 hypothetical protein P152DRAFT_480087 [Eremomyces bilateralis CBS 781.70]